MPDTVSSRSIPIIISTMLLLFAIIGAFWSVADPRKDLDQIRKNYLTVREHEQFVMQSEKDSNRLDRQIKDERTALELRLSKLATKDELAIIAKQLSDNKVKPNDCK